MRNRKLYVGVFREGKCLFRLGASSYPDYATAALACMLIEPGVAHVLKPGDNVACDYM